MTCNDCSSYEVCYAVHAAGGFQEYAEACKNFKNKADFVEVVRCEKCKYGDVSTITKAKDGQDEIACYCNLKKVVTDVHSYCPRKERQNS